VFALFSSDCNSFTIFSIRLKSFVASHVFVHLSLTFSHAAQTMNESVFQAALVNTFGAALAPQLTALYPLDPVNLTGYAFHHNAPNIDWRLSPPLCRKRRACGCLKLWCFS
jgi:hypothetical protein